MSDIILYAHRGTNPYPDHSREAYVSAINWGADVIEPDLYLTKDGILVSSHDNHNYSNLTYAEAKAIEPALLTFGEVIEIAKAMSIETGRTIGIAPETKITDYATSEAVIKTLIAHGFTDPELVVIQSFNPANLQQLHDTIMPQYGVDIPLAYLRTGIGNPAEIATYADIVAPSVGSFSAADVATANAAGLKVVTWTLLGAKADIQTLVNMGVDAVFVDDTKLARESIEDIAGGKAVYGAAQADVVTGTTGAEKVYAMQGADVVRAGAGNDVVYGDGGNDVLFGGAGNDELVGGAGSDLLSGGAGIDTLVGGTGNDVIVASRDEVVFRAGDGVDLVSVDGTSTIRFDGILPAEVQILRDGNNLIIRAGGDALVLLDGVDPAHQPASITTADGFTLTGAQLAAMAVTGSDAEVAAALPGLKQILDSAPMENAAPDAINGAATGRRDVAITGQLVATDAEGDAPLTFALGRAPAHGIVEIAADGSYRYTPIAGFTGTDRLTFSVSDGHGGTDTATLALTILSSGAVGPDLIVNGGFEDLTGASDAATWGYRNTNPAGVIAGWVNVGDNRAEVHRDTIGGISAAQGTYWFDLEGAPRNARLVQSVSGIEAGETYRLKFSIADTDTAQASDTVKVYWGGQLIYTGTPKNKWQEITLDVAGGAGDGSNKLEFESSTASANGAGVALDKVSMVWIDENPNLIVNGSFEDLTGANNGNWSGDWGYRNNSGVIPGWNQTNTTAGGRAELHFDTQNGVNAKDGNVWFDMDGNGNNARLVQKVGGVENGATYRLTFSIADADARTTDDGLRVYWGGQLVYDGVPTNTWSTITIEVVGGAGDGANELVFQGTETSLNGYGAALDAVSLRKIADAPPPNTAPIATNDSGIETGHGAALTILASALLANDADTDGDMLSIQSVVSGIGGTVSLDAEQSIVFTPAAGFSGEASFSYTVEDGKGGTASASVTLTVAAPVPVGTPGDDELAGTDRNDTIQAGDGDDVVEAGAGNDMVDGGEGDDLLEGEHGDDTLKGGAGDDALVGGAGNDRLEGAEGDDTLDGGEGDDTLLGGTGADTLLGGAGNDSINAGAGDDVMGGDGDDIIIVSGEEGDATTVDAGDGNDELINSSSGRIIGGLSMSGGNDKLANFGSISGPDGVAIDMGDGDDVVNLYIGTEVAGAILLGAGNDRLTADMYLNGAITVDAGDGDDTITTSFGNDVIRGGAGNDYIFAEAGNDTIDAGDGDDTILADLGDDMIDGGEGFDTLFLARATGPVTVDFAAGKVSGDGIGLDSFSNIEKLLFGAGNDIVTGGSGDDGFDGGVGNDTLKGGAGNDTLWAAEGDDHLDGGSGDDDVFGGVGNDVIKGGSGTDLIAAGEGDDSIDAGSGDDIVLGGEGHDVIDGGSGDDRIQGGAGDDALSGGSGHDVFVFAVGFGKDTVTDFRMSGASSDVLEFDDAIFADFDAAMNAAQQIGADTVFTIDADTVLSLQSIQLANLVQDDFRFV